MNRKGFVVSVILLGILAIVIIASAVVYFSQKKITEQSARTSGQNALHATSTIAIIASSTISQKAHPSSTISNFYKDKLVACGALANNSVQNMVETQRTSINLPRANYLVNDSGYNEDFHFETASGTATALYVSNGGPWGEGLDATPECWSTYFQFDGNGEVDLKVKSSAKNVPDYFVRFIVTGYVPPEFKFTGVIQAVNDPSSNVIYLKVNNKWISVWKGTPSSVLPEGFTIGLDFNNTQNNVGRTVEVFAVQASDSSTLTVFGDSKYYVKVIQ